MAAIRLEVGFYGRHAYNHAASIAKNLNKQTEKHISCIFISTLSSFHGIVVKMKLN